MPPPLAPARLVLALLLSCILLTFGHGQEDRPQRHRCKHHVPSLTQNAPDLRSCSLWIEATLDEAHHRTRISQMHPCIRRLARQARRLIERQLHFPKALHQSRQFFGKPVGLAPGSRCGLQNSRSLLGHATKSEWLIPRPAPAVLESVRRGPVGRVP